MIYLLSLPFLSIDIEFQMMGTVSAAFSSDLLPNNLFFGLKENFTLKLMAQGAEINLPGAHAADITDIEFT